MPPVDDMDDALLEVNNVDVTFIRRKIATKIEHHDTSNEETNMPQAQPSGATEQDADMIVWLIKKGKSPIKAISKLSDRTTMGLQNYIR